MRVTCMGVASSAVAVGLALSLGACVTVGGSGVADPSVVTDSGQGTSNGTSNSGGKMSVNGVIVGDAPESGSSSVAPGDSTGSSSDDAPVSSSGASAPSAENLDMVGRWECATVWANGNKRTAAEAGQSEDYYEFGPDGTVTAHVSGISDEGTYVLTGTKGSITYPKSPDDSYNEVFEVNPTTDGTSWAMKVNFKGIAPDNFRVYKKVSSSSASASGTSGGSATRRLDYDDYDESDSGYGSSSSSSYDSDTPAPGTVVDGWKWV